MESGVRERRLVLKLRLETRFLVFTVKRVDTEVRRGREGRGGGVQLRARYSLYHIFPCDTV